MTAGYGRGKIAARWLALSPTVFGYWTTACNRAAELPDESRKWDALRLSVLRTPHHTVGGPNQSLQRRLDRGLRRRCNEWQPFEIVA
jgi:hypothetical protein